MTDARFFGFRPPGVGEDPLPGRLIVLEATDGAGRSTHVAMLREWLEGRGYAALDTGLRRSDLAGPGIERAKGGHTLDATTLNLFYAADFWDRLERRIIPALRAGMVVLADRYVFSLIARAVVRGVSAEWMEELYSFALVPDLVIYLDIDVEHLLPRVISSSGFDYWESGQDFLRGPNVFDTFVAYQEMLLLEFRRLAELHDFRVVDARGTVSEIHRELRSVVDGVIRGMAGSKPSEATWGRGSTPSDASGSRQVSGREPGAPWG